MGELRAGHWSTRELPAPHNINPRKLSQRSPFQREDPAPLNDQQSTVLNTLCQTTNKTGTQPYPLAENLPNIIIISQTPKIAPLDTVLSTRKTASSLNHQNTGASRLHQEAYTTKLNKTYPLGADTRNNVNYEPAACQKETPNAVS